MLQLLHREAGVYEKCGVLFLVQMAHSHENGHACLHRTDCGDAGTGFDINIEEVFAEACHLILQLRNPVDIRIDGGHAPVQSGLLGINADLHGRQAGNAHLHADELFATGGFNFVYEPLHFADGGLADVGQLALPDFRFDDVGINRCRFHYIYIMVFNSYPLIPTPDLPF